MLLHHGAIWCVVFSFMPIDTGFEKEELALNDRSADKRRKGFTLAELSIVLALVAIVATIVTSFCLLVHQRSVVSRARLDIVNEVTVVRIYAERWVEKMHEQGAEFALDGNVLSATKEEKTYNFKLDGDKLVGDMPEGSDRLSYTTTRIDSVSFEILKKEGNTDEMLVFTVTALLPKANSENKTETYTFCVDSRIGETFTSEVAS